MRLFLNGLGAITSSGLTYIRNVVPLLSRQPGLHTSVALSPQLRDELGNLPNVSFVGLGRPAGAARRFWLEQTVLPRLLRQTTSDVLISAGNFALWRSPIPQILLSGNSLYNSTDFYRDLVARRAYRIWLDTRIKAFVARASIRWADCTVAPSQAFAEELWRWAEGKVVSIHHGFDPGVFFHDASPLPIEIQQKLDSAQDALRLLFVTHYNYYRNFETLFRAMPLLRERECGRKIRLFITCKLRSEENPGSYRAEAAADLVRRLGIAGEIVELGAIPYHLLHHVYRACEIYVTPAYTETFAHPVIEAMASGLPVVASDLPVHREVCGPAALYFQRFSAEELAEQCFRLGRSGDLRRDLVSRGLTRSSDFSWEQHVLDILALARTLTSSVRI
jgi:glycosyltransferase involved in cell wall biosynthesis